MAAAVEERSARGPVVGVPLIWHELGFLAEWMRWHPAVRAFVEGSMVVLNLRTADARELADTAAKDLPSLARSVRAALEAPAAVSSLTQEEQVMVGRVRRTRAGRLTLQVDDGVPSIVPERHWRWHGGGVEGYMQQSVSEVVSMAWSRARREADPGEVDWGEVRSALSEVAEGGRKTTAAAERAARLLERVEGRWGVVREAEEAMARLDVVRQALGVPAEAPVVSRPVPRPKPEASETAGARRAAGSSHERVLAAARRIADTDGVFRQPELRRTLAEEPLGAIPRTTMITVLTRLADDGAVERVTDEPGTWRLVSSQ